MSKERLGKIALYVTADILIIIFSLIFSISVWRQGIVPGANIIGMTDNDFKWLFYIAPAAVLLALATNIIFRLYGNLWKYASIDEVIKIFIAAAFCFILLYIYDYFLIDPLKLNPISRRMYFIAFTAYSFALVFTRFGYRMCKRLFITAGHLISRKTGYKRVMVVGASFAGYGAVKSMQQSPERERMPVIVVDPDLAKNNTSLLGVRVVGGLQYIPELVKSYEIDEIVIAMPSGAPNDLRTALDICAKTACRLKIMPPISDVTDSKSAYTHLRDVNISDLLYRDEIVLDTSGISSYIENKVVLVTGGGGTIGSELCRQIAPFKPKSLIILDLYENGAFELIDELKDLYGEGLNISLRLGSVRDMPRLRELFSELKPAVVFHAAAHKHVMVVEENCAEAVKNNIFGTLNAAFAALEFETERFVLISSDKAVNPANVYGATKRVAELIVQGMAEGRYFGSLIDKPLDVKNPSTLFMTVRFGNVLGASGSVLHLFKRQILSGGPVKVTGPYDMVRFFMTIPEACRLVLAAAALGETGKILALDMGEPVRITDLARKMIMLCGYIPDKDIKIIYTSLRPGDKLYEELLTEEEKDGLKEVLDGKVFITKPVKIDYTAFESALNRLKTACENGGGVIRILKELVPQYK